MGDFNKKIEFIKSKIGPTELAINRIPEKTKTRFMQLAKEEFCKDYGMCFKYLVDFRDGLLMTPESRVAEELTAKIDVLAEEIKLIKVQMKEAPKEESKIKLLSGRTLNRRDKK